MRCLTWPAEALGRAWRFSRPRRDSRRGDIALATQDSNSSARATNEKFAGQIGANIRQVNLGTYRNSDLGIRRGDGYRVWLIEQDLSRGEFENGTPKSPGVHSDRNGVTPNQWA